eukprot:4328706-Prorocentrum_lima.AAC.1
MWPRTESSQPPPRPNRARPMGVDMHRSCSRCTNAGARALSSFVPVRGAGRAKFASNAMTNLQTGPT